MFPKQVADLLFQKNWFGKQSLKIWNLVPSCLLWTLWKDHNSCNSKDKESSMAQLESLIIRTMRDWPHACGLTNSNYLFNFQESLFFFCIILCNSFRLLCIHYCVHKVVYYSIKYQIIQIYIYMQVVQFMSNTCNESSHSSA